MDEAYEWEWTATEGETMILPEQKDLWEKDCLTWRGRVLTGKLSHWCNEWDGLPVDETTDEVEHCPCFEPEPRKEFSRAWLCADGVVHATDVYFFKGEDFVLRRRRCDRLVVPEGEGRGVDEPVTCFGCMGAP